MEDLLSRLQQLNLPHEAISHNVVMTVDEQAEALKGHSGSVTKNLFLKDKKGRLYIVTALPATQVNMKTLSARLGCGKGGIRMASEELVPSVLGVPMGSVTPLALANPTAANVVLLLDQKIRSETSIFVHPLHNAASLALTPAELETFLGSLGREAVYVDLEAEPVIDQSNPPDLKAIAEMAAPAVGKEGETAEAGAPEPAAAKAAAAPAPKAAKKPAAGKPSKGKEGTAGAAGPKLDIYEIAARLLAKTSAELGQDVNALSADALRRLKADVAMELNIVRNAAYAAGFKAAQASVVAAVQNTFA